MAKRGGFPGGGMGMPGNMNNLMKQAQRMQRQMEESQKELETKEFTAKAGGGAVEVTVTGKKEITKTIHAFNLVVQNAETTLSQLQKSTQNIAEQLKIEINKATYIFFCILTSKILSISIHSTRCSI